MLLVAVVVAAVAAVAVVVLVLVLVVVAAVVDVVLVDAVAVVAYHIIYIWLCLICFNNSRLFMKQLGGSPSFLMVPPNRFYTTEQQMIDNRMYICILMRAS